MFKEEPVISIHYTIFQKRQKQQNKIKKKKWPVSMVLTFNKIVLWWIQWRSILRSASKVKVHHTDEIAFQILRTACISWNI